MDSELLLQNRVALVTGASGGIGIAVAKALFSEGCKLMLAARDHAKLQETREQIGGTSGSIKSFVADVTNERDVNNLVSESLESFQGIDILVNCAGIYGPIGPAQDLDAEAWMDTIRTNLYGTFLCIQAVLTHMIEKRKGKIINLSGGGSVSPFPRFSAYSASKAAVVRLTETLACEVNGYNIDINAIAPGAVNTQMLDQVLAAGELAGREFLEKSIRQKDEGGTPPEKAAELAVFLASPLSDGLTGRLISAVWDNWRDIPAHLKEISSSDIYTMRRILPEDRGYHW